MIKKGEIYNFIKNKQIQWCFLSSVFFGILTYTYFFASNLFNPDSISNTPSGYGAGLTSGRWLLWLLGEFIGKVWGRFNVPMFNGIISILILSVTSCIIVNILEIKNKWLSACLGAITIVFPSIASTMFYSFTVGYYSLAIFFVIFGILLIKKINYIGLIFASVLFSFSLGIYQAYYPLCLSVIILLLIKMCLDEKYGYKEIIIYGIKFIVAIIMGYILYRVTLQTLLNINNMGLTNYQGISDMGKIDLALIPRQILSIYSSIVKLPIREYGSINITLVIRMSILLLYIVTFISLVINLRNGVSGDYKIIKRVLLCLLVLVLPIAINFIIIMVPNGGIHVLMQIGFVCIFYFAIIMVDSLPKDYLYRYNIRNKMLNLTIGVMLISVMNYVWLANGNFQLSYYVNRQMENYYSTLFTRIKSVEKYSQDMEICFVGENIDDKTFKNIRWEDNPFKFIGGVLPLNSYSRKATIENYFGYSFTMVKKDSDEYIKYKNYIDEMDRYPNYNSIKVIDDKVFVRFE